ncbi:hypothetical protein HNQ96_005397 [Aminobacter lissarensis]|uniref:Uncharacterized protein n=1 Tax=Aminobacter carboxidus TaxID=376165 RepID=A0A8E2BG19_9HYPH|nr:hypothetical protein [Aminobacter lissarensis]MBB6469507.1 hypothetical protein [Aminobacter lissarensis]
MFRSLKDQCRAVLKSTEDGPGEWAEERPRCVVLIQPDGQVAA